MADQARVRKYFFLHMRPNRLPAVTLRYTHTFGLGGSSLVLITVLMVQATRWTSGFSPRPLLDLGGRQEVDDGANPEAVETIDVRVA